MKEKTAKLSPLEQRFILHWGEMGTKWGINRTVAQIHALLFVTEKPLNAEEITDKLGVARSNVSNSLRELQNWGIINVVHLSGDRRDHFESMSDVYEMFRTIAAERKKREIDPTLKILKECIELTIGEKHYSLRRDTELATMVVRPRGWHLEEKHILINGEPAAAALVDFGLFFFHNGKFSLEKGNGPYFYLPKMESHLEARLWNDIFTYSQKAIGIPHGSIRATVLVETILAALEMEEILYELRHHASGLNAGRWDYIFSAIKRFRNEPGLCFPDRIKVSMTVPFMRAYTERLVRICHKRGAHAIGGMAAFIPNRRDPEATEKALTAVRSDKAREANDGFDGSWVAHPDLVEICTEEFSKAFGDRKNQKDNLRLDVDRSNSPSSLIDFEIPGAGISMAGLVGNIRVAIEYIESWLRGVGAAAINNMMEDAATAEISRAQVWHWIQQSAQTEDGTTITKELYKEIADKQTQEIIELRGDNEFTKNARTILDGIVLTDDFVEFLTLPAYDYFD